MSSMMRTTSSVLKAAAWKRGRLKNQNRKKTWHIFIERGLAKHPLFSSPPPPNKRRKKWFFF
jgi:hypothetical protein